MKSQTSQKILFSLFFAALGLISLQIPFTTVLGSGSKFTLYDFIAPTAGVFLTTIPGILSVLLIQLLNIILHGSKINLSGFIRLFPILFGVFYFSKQRKVNVIVPLICIFAFNLHPVGRSAWQYSLYWLIPPIAHFFRKNLYLRSLGTTFAVHAVGGALWIWVFGLSREMWLALIPQTAVERLLMAGGISISFILLNKATKLGFVKKLLPSSAFS